jgi:phosphate transport system permease protein
MMLPTGSDFQRVLNGRQRRGRVWARFFSLSTVIAILALIALFYNVVNQAFGYVASTYETDPATLAPEGDLDALSSAQLVQILADNRNPGVYVRDLLSSVPAEEFTTTPLSQVLTGKTYPAEVAELTYRDLTPEQVQQILVDNVSKEQLIDLVSVDVVGENILELWPLSESILNRAEIEATVAEEYPEARLYFRSWLSFNFLLEPMATNTVEAGIRTALFGTILVMIITVVFSFTIGVGAAIYLQEYAENGNRVQKFIETNIRNLAGVPSIIYGLLGLAIFVRALEGITQGRTILSAALTMGLLILPVIIINAQEALRAVPSTLREASFGLGATKWQTIWRSVLPAAVPGILTGTILAMSRAIGETAPLIVIGASTFIVTDPNGPFSKFTALPIQIYQWTSRPQDDFRAIAASAIIVLLVLLLLLNATAIIMRQRFRRNLQG